MNQWQKEAVFADISSPLIIVAPPGSGKTHCITQRIGHVLSQGVAPERILCMTFTNKAAKEMKERVERTHPKASGILLTTFHSFCFRLCREQRWLTRTTSIWTDKEQRRACITILTSKLKKDDPNADVSRETLAPLLPQAMSLVSDGRANDFQPGSDERFIIESYQRMKREQDAIDFEDMIMLAVRNLSSRDPQTCPLSKYQVIQVDEWQDTSATQLELVKLFSRHTRSITVVGDPNQSIYGWRGADFSNWKKLQELLKPKVVHLAINYRSSSIISSVCQGLIQYNAPLKLGSETPPSVQTVLPFTEPVQVVQCKDAEDEALFITETMKHLRETQNIPFEQMAVLYRSNPKSKVTKILEQKAILGKVPYHVVAGANFYEIKFVKHVLAFLRLLLNPRDEMAWDMCCKYPLRGLKGAVFESKWKEYRGRRSSCEALDDFLDNPCSLLQDFRSPLMSLGGWLRSWRKMLDRTDLSLTDFIRKIMISEANFSIGPDEMSDLEFFCYQASLVDGKVNLMDQIILFLEQVALFGPSPKEDVDMKPCTLSTIHQSKGLEWTVVFVIQCSEGVIPSAQSLRTEDKNVDEERRLMFVAMSRAKRHLFLTYPLPPPDGRRSRFVEEVMGCIKPKLTTSRSGLSDFSSARSLMKSSTERKKDNAPVIEIFRAVAPPPPDPEPEPEPEQQQDDEPPKFVPKKQEEVPEKPANAFEAIMKKRRKVSVGVGKLNKR